MFPEMSSSFMAYCAAINHLLGNQLIKAVSSFSTPSPHPLGSRSLKVLFTNFRLPLSEEDESENHKLMLPACSCLSPTEVGVFTVLACLCFQCPKLFLSRSWFLPVLGMFDQSKYSSVGLSSRINTDVEKAFFATGWPASSPWSALLADGGEWERLPPSPTTTLLNRTVGLNTELYTGLEDMYMFPTKHLDSLTKCLYIKSDLRRPSTGVHLAG